MYVSSWCFTKPPCKPWKPHQQWMVQSLAEAQAGSETRVFLGHPAGSLLTASRVLASQMSSEKPAAAAWGMSTPAGAHPCAGLTLPVWVTASPESWCLPAPRGPSHARLLGHFLGLWFCTYLVCASAAGGRAHVWIPQEEYGCPPDSAEGLDQSHFSSPCTPGVPASASRKLWRGFYRPQRMSLTQVPPWALEIDKKGVAGVSAKGV